MLLHKRAFGYIGLGVLDAIMMGIFTGLNGFLMSLESLCYFLWDVQVLCRQC